MIATVTAGATKHASAGRRELPDDENGFVVDEIERIAADLGQEDAGPALGVTQQTVSAALKKRRAGRLLANGLYAYLKTTREAFLAAKTGQPPPIDRRTALKPARWIAAGFTAESASRIVAVVRDEMIASAIAAELDDDDDADEAPPPSPQPQPR